VGVAYGPHVTFGHMAALEFADGWVADESAVAQRRKAGPLKVDGTVAAKAKAKASTQWKSLGTCPVCLEAIKGGRVVEVSQVGGKMHAACFQCSSCSTQLSGVPFKVQGRTLYCSTCFFEKHGEKCTACNKVISGGMMKCAMGKFHPECIICSKCNASIGKAQFSTAGGVFTCQGCSSQSRFGAVAQRGGPRTATSMPAGARPGSTQSRSDLQARPGSRQQPTGRPARPGSQPHSSPKSKASSPANSMTRQASVPSSRALAAPKKVSLTKAGATLVGLGSDYANLAD